MAISDARHRANEKYNAKAYDEIKVRVAKGRKAELQAFVERHGQSVNGFINGLIDEAMDRERAPAEAQMPTEPPQTDRYTGPGSPEWWAQRARESATEEAGGGAIDAGEQFPYFPDDEETPHAAVGVSPMHGEESSSAEPLFPDDWEEDEKDLPW